MIRRRPACTCIARVYPVTQLLVHMLYDVGAYSGTIFHMIRRASDLYFAEVVHDASMDVSERIMTVHDLVPKARACIPWTTEGFDTSARFWGGIVEEIGVCARRDISGVLGLG